MIRLRWVGLIIGLVWLCFPGMKMMGDGVIKTVYRFDLTHLYELDLSDPVQAREAWDMVHLIASLQGNVNRFQPLLFLRFMAETDDFWLTHLRSPGNWLDGVEVREIESLEGLLAVFRPQIQGLVLYTEEVRATSNLASTVAGVENRICLRYDPAPESLYNRVMRMDLGWHDVLELFGDDGSSWGSGRAGEPIAGTNPPVPSTGSAKGDAYLWAKQRYLDSGRTSDEFLAYYIDSYWLEKPTLASLENFTLSNHDFFIRIGSDTPKLASACGTVRMRNGKSLHPQES